jgi:hypothetical protein
LKTRLFFWILDAISLNQLFQDAIQAADLQSTTVACRSGRWYLRMIKLHPLWIALHLIPADETIWTENSFESFIEERAKLILKKLEEHTAAHQS